MGLNEMSNSDPWSEEYLIDNIFNNMMKNGYDHNTNKNKYIDQIIDKFKFFRLRSPVVYFEIGIKDLDTESIFEIDSFTKNCNTKQEKYIKLNGIFTEVIARIGKQAEPFILSLNISEEPILLITSLNQLREIVSFKWRIVK